MKKTFLLIALAAAIVSSCKKESQTTMPSSADKVSTELMDQFFAKHSPKDEKFTLDASTGGTLEMRSGTKIFFPPNVFQTQNGDPVSGTISVIARDILKPSSMILADKPTLTSSGEMLESFGEIIVSAQQNKEELVLNKDRTASVEVPIGLGPKAQRREIPMWEGDTVISVTQDGYNHENVLTTVSYLVGVRKGMVWDQIPGFGVASTNTTVFPLDALGAWRNCDALYNDPRPKTTVLGYFGDKFNSETGNSYSSSDPSLLFFKTKGTNTLVKLYNTIFQPAPGKEGLLSYQDMMPIGQEGTFLAISAKNSKLYAEIKDVSIPAPDAGKNYVGFNFELQEVSETQLLNMIDQMNTK